MEPGLCSIIVRFYRAGRRLHEEGNSEYVKFYDMLAYFYSEFEAEEITREQINLAMKYLWTHVWLISNLFPEVGIKFFSPEEREEQLKSEGK